jgi:hypothetical protein
MEDTNPQGSAKTVSQAAESFLNLMEPQEAQAQPEAPEEQEAQAVESEEYESEDSQEYEDSYEESEPTPTYKVKVGKEELEVPLDELLKGYSRTADYTRKTQEIAETRKAVEADRQKIEEASRLRDTYAQRLSVIEQMLSQGAEKAEDLAALKESDPIGYAVKVAEQTEREKQLTAVRAEQARIVQQQQADQQQRLQAHLQAEAAKLQEMIPEMADTAKSQAVKTDIRNYAKKLGFSDQELQQVYDHRAVTALYKAMQYDKLTAGKNDAVKKVAQAPRMMRPGTFTPEARESQEGKKLREQLRRSGKKNDAARIFERLL